MNGKLKILDLSNTPKKDFDLKEGQTVTCSHTFQVKIEKIHEELGIVEFICLGTGKREMLPIRAFKKVVQTLH